MTPQEQQMIDGLIDRVRTTRVQEKDTQAEQHIQQGLSGTPDALYVLVQTVLVQQYGLEQAQSQINELKRQVEALQQSQANAAPPKSSSGSFLSHIFGSGNPQPTQPGQQSGYQPVNNPGYGTQGYPPPPPAYPQQTYPSSGGGMFGGGAFGGGGMLGGGSGGFLRGAMQTAAGVAAGELMFQGMEDIFRGFGGGGHERGFDGGSSETVVNNYYGDDDRSGEDRDRGVQDDQSFYNPDDDASRNDLGDTGSNAFADTSTDDLNFSDNSSADGGFDMGGGDDFSSDNS